MRFCSFLFTLLAASSALAFQPATLLQRQARMQLASASDTEKLNDMSKKWESLRRKEKEVERSHDEVSKIEFDEDFVC